MCLMLRDRDTIGGAVGAFEASNRYFGKQKTISHESINRRGRRNPYEDRVQRFLVVSLFARKACLD